MRTNVQFFRRINMAKSKNAGKGSVAQVQDKDERRKALDAAMAQIEKQFGQGAVMRLGDKSQVEIDTIPTGALTLDIRHALCSYERSAACKRPGCVP